MSNNNFYKNYKQIIFYAKTNNIKQLSIHTFIISLVSVKKKEVNLKRGKYKTIFEIHKIDKIIKFFHDS